MRIEIPHCRNVINRFRKEAGDILGEARTQGDAELEQMARRVITRARQLARLPVCHETRIQVERFSPTVRSLESARDRARVWRARCARFKAWCAQNAPD